MNDNLQSRRRFFATTTALLAAPCVAGCGASSHDEQSEKQSDQSIDKPIAKVNVEKRPANTGPLKLKWNSIAKGGSGPGARSRHCIAYNSQDKSVVLFGGINWGQGGGLLADTWELRNRHWSRINTSNGPSKRHRGAMVYDSKRGNCVLFGGQTQEGFFSMPILADTWIYTNGKWARRDWPSSVPPARCGHAFAFDDDAGVAVLFGGIDKRGVSLADTWIFNGDAWKQVDGPAPSARRYSAFAYDPDLKGCVLNGGSLDDHGAVSYGDTWLFRDSKWERLDHNFDVAICDDHSLAYHRTARNLIMFGGLRHAGQLLRRTDKGWQKCQYESGLSSFQCSQMVWCDDLNGIVMHGGESGHAGKSLDETWVLQVTG